MKPLQNEFECIIRLPEVKTRTGLSRSTIYANIKTGNFPNTISLGPRSVGWLKTEIDSWISSRIQKSRASNFTA